MEQWQQFQVMTPQLMSSRFLTMILQGLQNALQKSRPVNIKQ